MKNVYPPLYTLNGEVIKEVDSVRYLGHIISSNGKDDKDIMRQCQQLYARGNVLLRKFHMCYICLIKKIAYVLYGCESEIVEYVLFTYVHCAIMVEPHCI